VPSNGEDARSTGQSALRNAFTERSAPTFEHRFRDRSALASLNASPREWASIVRTFQPERVALHNVRPLPLDQRDCDVDRYGRVVGGVWIPPADFRCARRGRRPPCPYRAEALVLESRAQVLGEDVRDGRGILADQALEHAGTLDDEIAACPIDGLLDHDALQP
jgi:hypothetical protein